MSYTYIQLAKKVLEDSPKALQLGAIWKQACEKGLEKKLDSTNPTKQALSSVLRTELKKPDTAFFAKSKNPALFGIKGKHSQEITDEDTQDQENQGDESQNESDRGFYERDLHPLFVKFAYENLGIECKTIYHEESKKGKRGQNKWLHPDVVGVHNNAYKCQASETKMFLQNNKIPNTKLYSFELKKSLESSNLKESYFQAVSNSSWANEGYLVVFGDIEQEELEELNKLHSRFGIGVITFNAQLESENEHFKIIIPASINENLDIAMIDEIVLKNRSFKDFIGAVMGHNKNFDEILDDEKLKAHIQEHKILG